MQQELFTCSLCKLSQHHLCIGKNIAIKPYKCPYCLVSTINPLMSVKCKVPPTVIPLKESMSKTEYKKMYELSFYVSEEELKNEEFYVRCIRLDGKSAEHKWPLHGTLNINNKMLEEFQIPNENDDRHKRKDYPKKLSKNELTVGINKIVIIRNSKVSRLAEVKKEMLRRDNEEIYSFVVVKGYKITPDTLVNELVRNKPPIEKSRKIFMKKLENRFNAFFESEDCICEQNSIELRCSNQYLPNKMINIPAYNEYCEHLESFDLKDYITMNEKENLWKCPHCPEIATQLTIDTYFEKVLTIIRSEGITCTRIYVDQEGNFITGNIKLIYTSSGFITIKENSSESDNEEDILYDIENISPVIKKEKDADNESVTIVINDDKVSVKKRKKKKVNEFAIAKPKFVNGNLPERPLKRFKSNEDVIIEEEKTQMQLSSFMKPTNSISIRVDQSITNLPKPKPIQKERLRELEKLEEGVIVLAPISFPSIMKPVPISDDQEKYKEHLKDLEDEIRIRLNSHRADSVILDEEYKTDKVMKEPNNNMDEKMKAICRDHLFSSKTIDKVEEQYPIIEIISQSKHITLSVSGNDTDCYQMNKEYPCISDSGIYTNSVLTTKYTCDIACSDSKCPYCCVR